MELIQWFIDLVLHLDDHLVELLVRFDVWIYAIVFLVVFAETGLVVTPFLPGDSLLFALGALAAIDTTGTLSPFYLVLLLMTAAILGDAVNYTVGRAIGHHAFSGRYRWIKVDYLRQTERYFAKHGSTTIVLARFAPIIRTYAPFIAGVGHMHYPTFFTWNVLGAVLWVNIFIWAGYFFGNIPFIKDNFGFVTIAIIVVSLTPMVVMMIRQRREARSEGT